MNPTLAEQRKPLVLLVDDEISVANVVCRILEAELYEVAVASSVAQARTLLGGRTPDLAILDRRLPDGDGLDVCREMRARPETLLVPILFMSGQGSAAEKTLGLRMGGDDYMTKPFNSAEFLARIHALLRRSSWAAKPPAPAVLSWGPLRMNLEARVVRAGDCRLDLSNKQFAVLQALLERNEAVLTRGALLERVWNCRAGEKSRKAVDMIVVGLRRKLGRWGDLIESVRGQGYRLRAQAGALLALALLCIAAPARAQKQTDHPLAQLARSPAYTGFGGSFSAFSMNALDAMGQPGLYGQMSRANLAFSHIALFQGASYDAFGYIFPTLKKGTLGAGLFLLNSGKGQGRDEFGQETGSFDQSAKMLRLGYGNYIQSDLTLGGNLSYLIQQFAGRSSSVMSIDMGAQYTGVRSLTVGAAVDHLAYLRSGDASADKWPAVVRLNAGYTLWKDLLLLGADMTVLPQAEYRIGLQYSLVRNFDMRVGRSKDTSSLGFGLNFGRYHMDYNLGMHELGASHQILLSTQFSRARIEQRDALARKLYRDTERQVSRGRYADSLESLRQAQRYQNLPAEMRVLKDGLEKLEKAKVRDVSGASALQEELRKGVSFFLNKKPDLAKDVFLQVQAKDPKNLMIRRLLAMTGQENSEEKPGADSGLPSFTEVDPVKLKLFKTEEYFQKQQWDLALKECREILALNPREVLAYVRMGSIFYALGMKSQAFEAWKYADRLDPNNPQVRRAAQFMRQQAGAAPRRQGR